MQPELRRRAQIAEKSVLRIKKEKEGMAYLHRQRRRPFSMRKKYEQIK